MNPIPGQPGLYRSTAADARRTALSDFSVPPPRGPYTWDVKRGPPWTLGGGRGLGDLPSLRSQLAANQQRFDEYKRLLTPLLTQYPFSSASYTTIASRIATMPRSTVVRLTTEQFTVLARAMLSTVSLSNNLSRGILSGTPSAGQEARARKMLFAAKDTMDRFETLLMGVHRAQGAAQHVGLGLDPVITPGVIIAGIVGATLVILIIGGLVYAFLSTTQANAVTNAEAERACALDAARGTPCGGAEYAAYLQRGREEQRDWGNIPNIEEFLKQAGSLLFWGGLLAVGGLLAYGAWTAEPARRQFAARFAGARRKR